MRRSRCPVKHVFARTLPVFGRSNFDSRNFCDGEPRLHSNPFITKKQLNPSRFSNKNYKLIVLILFIAEAASHSIRETVTQDTTAIVRFTLHLPKSLIIKYYTLAIATSFLQLNLKYCKMCRIFES